MTALVMSSHITSVQTKFYGPTSTWDSRIKASAYGSHKWVDWCDDLGVEDNHDRAAKVFIDDKAWLGTWVGGANTDSTGYNYVRID